MAGVEQAIELVPDLLVALAGPPFEPTAIDDRDPSPPVVDRTCVLRGVTRERAVVAATVRRRPSA
jgi:hypothetical protein